MPPDFTGLITGRNATLRFGTGLTNNGSIGLCFGTSDVFGDMNNGASGVIAVAGNSQVTFYDDVANSGVLNVVAGSAAVFSKRLLATATAATCRRWAT